MLQRKIKVCFVQSFTYSFFNPNSSFKIGGIEVDLYNNSTELAQDKRFGVYFLVADFNQKDIEICKNVEVIRGHSIKRIVRNYLSIISKNNRLIQ